MANLRILNSREVKEIRHLLKEQYGFDEKLNYVFLRNEKDKIFIATNDISKINFDRLRLNTVGLYFAQLKDGKIRLSIEGAQIIGSYSKKNVAGVSDEGAIEWLKGGDISIPGEVENNAFLILKNRNDFLGCGKYANGKVFNFVSKPRRLN